MIDQVQAARSPQPAANRHGRHDPAHRRSGQRRGRERGCWVYIAADQLQTAGIDPQGPTPFYRIWPARGGSVVIRLYREA